LPAMPWQRRHDFQNPKSLQINAGGEGMVRDTGFEPVTPTVSR
jgi:hypothetical protein